MKRNKSHTEQSFWDMVDKSGKCWVWNGYRHSQGYGRVKFNGNTWLAHRLAYFLFYKDLPRKLDVMHKCDNPPCVNPNHLILGTHKDNMVDAGKKGRMAGPRKFTMPAIQSIRAANKVLGVGPKDLGKIFNINRSTMSRILTNKSYRLIKTKETNNGR